ncbi:putative aminotransferase YcbU [Terrabacter tumescens]|uniref:Aminotransferase YcbU n=2 Tax=Terrabacter tumescens TaxID=60443 RepID=A0ABQ2I4V5_9MICO|nr:putative aminotransferase YcbU [Terrabacter tumescens]
MAAERRDQTATTGMSGTTGPTGTTGAERTSIGVGEAIRHRFPVLAHKAYLNACSQGALSDAVRQSYAVYLDGMDDEGSLWEYWVSRQEDVRQLLATLIGAPADACAITTSESAGISALASGLDFADGRDTIVTTELEFPTVGQIWHAQERRGARVVHLPTSSDLTLDLATVEAALDERTAILSVTEVCYRNGARVDVRPLIELAHARGILVHVDVYQSFGGMPFDLAQTPADIVTGGFLKYLLGSPGVAFLYANPETTGHIIPVQTGWMAARDIWSMDIHDYDPAKDARRFESGTPPVPSLFAAAAGLRLMSDIGLVETRDHVEVLLSRLRAGVEEMGGTVMTPEASHGPMLAVAVTDEHAAVEVLKSEDIVVSSRDSNVRIAPHCYNTEEDIDAFLAGLQRHRDLLRTPG